MTVTAPPQTYRPVVRRARADEAPALAHTLADAFYDDPVGRWFVPSDRTRRARLERFFRLLSLEALALPHGVVHTTPDIAGACLWVPSAALETSTLDDLRMLPTVARIAGPRNLARVLRGMAAMDAVHPHEPHWYLPQVGVAVASQGQGIGGALMRPMLERLDAEGMPAYLEATTERNRALYERHGFEAYDVMHLPDGGPQMVLMWREPTS
jgi:ribosomal protein S18 acetylase RimI-like enzyme